MGTNIMRSVPVVGDDLQFLLLGSQEVSENALLRFYVLHCVVLPAILVGGIGLHIWRLRKDGGLHLPPEENRSEPSTPNAIQSRDEEDD